MPLSILGEQRTGAESRLAMDDSSAQSCTEGGLNPGVLGYVPPIVAGPGDGRAQMGLAIPSCLDLSRGN